MKVNRGLDGCILGLLRIGLFWVIVAGSVLEVGFN